MLKIVQMDKTTLKIFVHEKTKNKKRNKIPKKRDFILYLLHF